MVRKTFIKITLIICLLLIAACGGLRFNQLAPEAKDFHPRRIAVFPIEVWNHKEIDSRSAVEQIVAGSLVGKKYFAQVTYAENLQKQIKENEELSKVKDEFFSKLKMLNFSDPELSKKMGELANIDAFIEVYVDEWKYDAKGDEKTAQVGIAMEMYDVATGKLMWKASHSITRDYVLLKPELPKIADEVVHKMIVYIPH